MPPKMTIPVRLVLRDLLAADGERYGLEVIRATGLASGTVHPILARFEAAGWVTARDENIDPKTEGRHARRYYRLTDEGTAAARASAGRSGVQLAALDAQPAPQGKASPA